VTISPHSLSSNDIFDGGLAYSPYCLTLSFELKSSTSEMNRVRARRVEAVQAGQLPCSPPSILYLLTFDELATAESLMKHLKL
jgi:hypothetical protein